jgi:PhnB protein
MSTSVTPYLTFNGNCRDAMTFYKECFGGELTLQTVAETPMAAQCPSGMQQHIMHSMLAGDGMVIMGTDMVGPAGFIAGTDMALSLSFDNEETIRACYTRLSDGGQVIDPLKQAPWGALFGVVADPFGKVWMLNYSQNGSKP